MSSSHVVTALGHEHTHPQPLSVFIATWNLQGKCPTSDLLDLLPIDASHDIYCIGTEECEQSVEKALVVQTKVKWESGLLTAFSLAPGEPYVFLGSSTLQAIHIAIFVKQSLHRRITCVQRACVATGVGNVIGNKGAAAMSFCVDNVSFVFISSHFEAHQEKVQQRNDDYHRIQQFLPLRHCVHTRAALGARSPALTDRYERVFWLGDLNYRVDGTRSMVDALLKRGLWEVLVANDQLARERLKGTVFSDGPFHEGAILFLPTYRLDPGTDRYDTSEKARIPSWTDRILYRGPGITLHKYHSIRTLRASDHRPVVALFSVDLAAPPYCPGAVRWPPRLGPAPPPSPSPAPLPPLSLSPPAPPSPALGPSPTAGGADGTPPEAPRAAEPPPANPPGAVDHAALAGGSADGAHSPPDSCGVVLVPAFPTPGAPAPSPAPPVPPLDTRSPGPPASALSGARSDVASIVQLHAPKFVPGTAVFGGLLVSPESPGAAALAARPRPPLRRPPGAAADMGRPPPMAPPRGGPPSRAASAAAEQATAEDPRAAAPADSPEAPGEAESPGQRVARLGLIAAAEAPPPGRRASRQPATGAHEGAVGGALRAGAWDSDPPLAGGPLALEGGQNGEQDRGKSRACVIS